ncbi:MAG: hypothetical protein A2287_03350 [Candidatus Melainabacteria bacterium RIFOXYA12_FULL_32_12]|nr:MAG: hypothetical protein A2287_03350 [Candidatus Melainabacteria bacterium RIFOXYA12_FULL_32_12]
MKGFFINFLMILRWIRLIVIFIVIAHAFQYAGIHINMGHYDKINIVIIVSIITIFIIQAALYKDSEK